MRNPKHATWGGEVVMVMVVMVRVMVVVIGGGGRETMWSSTEAPDL